MLVGLPAQIIDDSNQPPPSKTKILIAEDNPHDITLLTEALDAEVPGLEYECVVDGDQLLDRLSTPAAYALVITDFHLPRRTAEEVLRAVREQTPRLDVPVAILTTMISEQDRRRLLNLGVREILSKPFNLGDYPELAKRLSALLPK